MTKISQGHYFSLLIQFRLQDNYEDGIRVGGGGASYELSDNVSRCIDDQVWCIRSDKVYKTVRELCHLIFAKRVIPHVSSLSIK